MAKAGSTIQFSHREHAVWLRVNGAVYTIDITMPTGGRRVTATGTATDGAEARRMAVRLVDIFIERQAADARIEEDQHAL